MRRICIAVALLGLAIGATPVSAETLYRWVDKNGRLHFTDTPPPSDAKAISKKAMTPNQGPAVPYTQQLARRQNPITLYIASTCGEPCAMGKKLLGERGVAYSEKDAINPAFKAEIKKLIASDDAVVPILVVGSKHLQGYDETEWSKLLGEAGYPSVALVPGEVTKVPPPPTPPASNNGQPPAAQVQPVVNAAPPAGNAPTPPAGNAPPPDVPAPSVATTPE